MRRRRSLKLWVSLAKTFIRIWEMCEREKLFPYIFWKYKERKRKSKKFVNRILFDNTTNNRCNPCRSGLRIDSHFFWGKNWNMFPGEIKNYEWMNELWMTLISPLHVFESKTKISNNSLNFIPYSGIELWYLDDETK